ncbi:hypothetical protein GCM10027056_30950 [Glaciibacter psychrotolerans]
MPESDIIPARYPWLMLRETGHIMFGPGVRASPSSMRAMPAATDNEIIHASFIGWVGTSIPSMPSYTQSPTPDDSATLEPTMVPHVNAEISCHRVYLLCWNSCLPETD